MEYIVGIMVTAAVWVVVIYGFKTAIAAYAITKDKIKEKFNE